MASGILVTVKTNVPALYVMGIILFLAGGAIMAGLAFGGVIAGGVGLGVIGIVLAVAAAVLLIEYLVTR